MTILRTAVLAGIIAAATCGPALAQGMMDLLREQQAQLEAEIEQLEQSGSNDEMYELKLQELKWKYQKNEETISELTGD